MTFSELKLCMAIVKADLGGGDRPIHKQRLESAHSVMVEFLYLFEESYFPYSIDDVERWRLNIRKQTDTRIKVEVAMLHGTRCFWAHRNMGECSNDAECGHLIPASQNGPLTIANCIIECRAHNNERRALTIEEYIKAKGLTA